MKRIILLLALLLVPSCAWADRALFWNKADVVEMPLFVPGSGGEDYFTGSPPEDGDCKVSVDRAAFENLPIPTLVGSARWAFSLTAAQTKGRHVTIFCHDADSSDYVDQMSFFDVLDVPSGPLQSCSPPDCPDNFQYAKLAATETAGDGTLVRSTFVTVDGAGAQQAVKICEWDLDTLIAKFCEPLAREIDNTTYYFLQAGDSEFTALEREQIRNALGLDGTKTAGSGGEIQAINIAADEARDVANRIKFDANDFILVNVSYVGTTQTTTAEDVKDFTSGQREQVNNALGLTGTKTAGSGGELQAIKAKTDQLTFSGGDNVCTLSGETVTLADGGITASKFGANAITADVVASNAIGAAELAADASTEIGSGIFNANSGGELQALPSASPTYGELIKFIYQATGYKLVTVKTGTSSGKQRVYKRNGTTILGEANVTDSGTTFTRDRYQ